MWWFVGGCYLSKKELRIGSEGNNDCDGGVEMWDKMKIKASQFTGGRLRDFSFDEYCRCCYVTNL